MTCTVIYQYLNVLCEYSSFLNPLIHHYRFGVIAMRHNNKSPAVVSTRTIIRVAMNLSAPRFCQIWHIFQLVVDLQFAKCKIALKSVSVYSSR